MKIPVIRTLAQEHSLEELNKAEIALIEGLELPFAIEGKDDGEKLTHVLGAQDILKRVAAGVEFNTALREFSQRVRNSIQ